MKTLLKIAIVLSMSGFALTSHAQSFDMLDIVKMMDRPAKQKAPGKKSKEVKKSRSTIEVELVVSAEQINNNKVSVLGAAPQTEFSADDNLSQKLPNTRFGEVLPGERQGELQLYNRRMEPAIADPGFRRNTPLDPTGRVK